MQNKYKYLIGNEWRESKKIYDDFISGFIDEAKTLKMGNPRDEETRLGPMIDEQSARRIESRVNEAVKQINDSIYGLQASVFTNNIRHVFYAYEHLEVGGVIVNDVPSFRADNVPYGGVKESVSDEKVSVM